MNTQQPSQGSLFRSSVQQVRDEWIDYNGHLNMAYYSVLFDRGVDEAFELLGLGHAYLETAGASYFTAEVHICYLRELAVGDPVYSTFQLLGHDEKRVHFFQQLFHAGADFLSATSEQMSLHVNMATKKVCPFPPEVFRKLASMHSAHINLEWPERAGRSIGVPVKPKTG